MRETYSRGMARSYDRFMAHFFPRFKKLAVNASSLKPGDSVLVFCCGTGLDFPHILDKVGSDGRIVGVDLSSDMLDKARERITRNNWDNIRLIQDDVTSIEGISEEPFDAGVCTLGMSIIPDYKAAYSKLVSHVRRNGEVIIGDMQLASGPFAWLNRITVPLARRYGGTRQGHRNSADLRALMEEDLADVRTRELVFRSYFYCIGKTR
jgi:demethylmenaquinone methyltransferase/2-methoxy-6-polyprenyl-1,4-benzoquinol methylase